MKKQDTRDFEIIACVNQYEWWWDDNEKRLECEDNQKSLGILQKEEELTVHLIDRSSKGKGWVAKKGGVGMARRTALDFISQHADDNAVMVSMDADTDYPSQYLSRVAVYFQENPLSMGLSLPYYHPLTGTTEIDRLILRYEIYMRYYVLNMIRISNPYQYTALGSAMAFPVWAYRKVGGLTPVKSGEDFYFLQKLVKAGELGFTAETQAYPSARFSDRVLFGTGPALIKGQNGDWSSYPFYPSSFFDDVEQTFESFYSLFLKEVATPMDAFLETQFKTRALWKPLRKNYKDRKNFIKACENKVDGLRILQYLRWRATRESFKNEEALLDYIIKYASSLELPSGLTEFEQLGFDKTSPEGLNSIRDFLFRWETKLRAESI